MSIQIIILNTNNHADGSFSVSGVFWLVAPSDLIVPTPTFKSQVYNITASQLLLLQNGTLVEQSFSTGLYPSGTSLADVQTNLQSLYTSAQSALDNLTPPSSGFVGAVFDGTTWSTSDAPLNFASQLVSIKGPKESDGKQIVVISPASEGMRTWLTSRGDDLEQGPAGRGLGTKLKVEFDGYDTYPCVKNIDLQFLEPMEVHDGQFNWHPPEAFGADDDFSVSVIFPPTVATLTPGTGNANQYPLGEGAVLYVPAAGDGYYTINLSNYAEAVPVPASGAGYWDVDDDGVITPSSTPGQATFHLVNFPSEAFLISNVCMLNNIGLFDVDVYKTEWVHQSWKIRLSVSKTSEAPGIASGWLLTFRKNVRRS